MKANNPTLTENAIRPDALMEESDRIHAADLARLLTRRSEFVEVLCPACSGSARSLLWAKEGFTYWRCENCESGYLSPRPNPELLAEYYRTAENYVFWSEKVFPASEDARRQQIAVPRMDRVLEILKKFDGASGTFIEVGAGHGTFCELAKQSGRFSRVVAVEPTPSNAAMCRARGLEVAELPIEKVELGKGAADVVVSFEVIEHLFSPGQFLSGCRRILRIGGLLVVSCPNLKGFEVAVLGAASRTVDPEHLNYFHPASLRLAVEAAGFEVIEVLTPGKLDAEIVRKRVMSGHHSLAGADFLKTVLMDQWEAVGPAFQDFLAKHLLSSHMWIVAKAR